MGVVLSGFLQRFYKAVDAMDAQAYAAFFADDATLTMGNFPAVIGAMAIKEQFADFNARALNGLRHEILSTATNDEGAVFLESRVTYRLRSGPSVTLPCMTVLRFAAPDRIASMRLYMDPSPLLTPSGDDGFIAHAPHGRVGHTN